MDIIKLNNSIATRNQFVFDSKNLLLKEVKTAFEFNDIQAKKSIGSICKLITFGLEAISKNLIEDSVIAFLSKCKNNHWIKPEDSYLLESFGFYDGVFQILFAKKFGIDVIGSNNYEEFITWSLTQTEFIGTLRIINAKKTGRHSLIVYKINGIMFISDTSNRGIGVLFEDYININNFIYFTSLCI